MIPEPAQPDAPPVEPGATAGPLAPVAEKERILAIDVLRGFALLGILAVNIQFFALPLGRAMLDPTLSDAHVSERVADAIISILFEYKFVSLFSLLFGIGLVIQVQRAAARGRSFTGAYVRRLGILALIGLAHGLLLWYGDILFIYAIGGVLLLFAPRMSGRALVILGVSLLAAGSVMSTSCITVQTLAAEFQPAVVTTDETVVTGPVTIDEMVSVLQDAQWNAMSEPYMAVETRAYAHGETSAAFFVRGLAFFSMLIFVAFGGFGLHILAMFFLGAGLMKLRFFDPDRWRWHVWLAVVGLTAGLAIESTGYTIEILNGHAFGRHTILTSFIHEWGSVILCLGYVGLITLLVNRDALAPVARVLGRTGRLALTVYLGETVIATALMYWWGLGWFGSVTRLQMLGLTAAIFGSLLVFAQLWLIPFRIGPAEWAWRCLTYLRVQPLLRRREA